MNLAENYPPERIVAKWARGLSLRSEIEEHGRLWLRESSELTAGVERESVSWRGRERKRRHFLFCLSLILPNRLRPVVSATEGKRRRRRQWNWSAPLIIEVEHWLLSTRLTMKVDVGARMQRIHVLVCLCVWRYLVRCSAWIALWVRIKLRDKESFLDMADIDSSIGRLLLLFFQLKGHVHSSRFYVRSLHVLEKELEK